MYFVGMVSKSENGSKLINMTKLGTFIIAIALGWMLLNPCWALCTRLMGHPAHRQKVSAISGGFQTIEKRLKERFVFSGVNQKIELLSML
jgi:hypothetical protein